MALILCPLLAGCPESEQINSYEVAKEANTPVAPPLADADDVQQFEATPQTAWFLKLTGPAEIAEQIVADFEAFAASTSIAGGSPQWSVPEGWKEEAGSGMRFATLFTPTDPPLELSVIKLPMRGSRDDYLLDNINRWRGQLGLAPWEGDDWQTTAASPSEVRPLETSGADSTIVDLTGQTEEFGEARMLAAVILPQTDTPGRSASPMTPPPVAAESSPADAPFDYAVPDGWQPGKMSIMRLAAFQVTEGEQSAEITVIKSGGDLLSNINRWRGQVGLGDWSDAELKEQAETVTLDGQPATYVNLAGAEQTILGVVLEESPQSWFIKLTGDSELAQQEEERFKAFVESIQFKDQ